MAVLAVLAILIPMGLTTAVFWSYIRRVDTTRGGYALLGYAFMVVVLTGFLTSVLLRLVAG